MKYDTLMLHNGNESDEETGALSIPVYNASTFIQKDISRRQKFDYSRSGNPTRSALEGTLAAIEHGTHAYAFASGMAAISSVILALFRPGDHLIVTKDIYGGAWRFFSKFVTDFNIDFDFIDCTDMEQVRAALRPATKGIYIESPTNPLMKVIDLKKIASFAKENEIISIIDNTFMSPYLMKPLDLGIDVSVHSATKFLGGHSDVLAGCAVTANEELAKKIYFVQNSLGAVLAPNDSWLLMRGIKTLGVRMKQQCLSAEKIAAMLSDIEWVAEVLYPGFADHPGHQILKEQASAFGCVLSIRCDHAERAHKILKNVHLWSPAVSLGGVESIISYPYIMSHGAIPQETREAMGITSELLRLSIGLEDPEDLVEDIINAAK